MTDLRENSTFLRYAIPIFEGEGRMVIGDKLRQLREEQNLSQGDIEKRTGLLRCYMYCSPLKLDTSSR